MLPKSLTSLALIALSVITAHQAKPSELVIPNPIVKFPCSVHNTTTLCPHAREEGQEIIKDTGRPPRD